LVKVSIRKYGLLGTVCAMVGVVTLAEAQERVRIFVQPDEFLGTIATELSANAGSRYRFEVSIAESDADVVQRVANDARAIGVVQHDTYLDGMRARGAGGAHLELYGDLPACLVVVAGKRSWIRSYGDLITASRGPAVTMDVGPANGRLAHMLEALQSADPMLGSLRLEHRGGSRALSRVVSGEIDAAMLLLQPPFADAPLDRLVNDGQVELVPFDVPALVAGSFEGDSPYRSRDIRLGDEGWFSSGTDYRAICTSVGVIVNSAADAQLSEAIAKSMLTSRFAETGHGWLATAGEILSASVAAVGRAFGWASDVVVAMLGLESDSNRAIAGNGSVAPPVIAASHRSDDAIGYGPRRERAGVEP
jgi:hypothetical protein